MLPHANFYPTGSGQIEAGEVSVEDIVNEAWENDVEIEWERQYDDWWTDRKGGYDITYELGSEKSWHTAPEEAPDTTKCTKCRWTGKNYETRTQHHRADGSVIENYHSTEEVSDHTSDVCPMCDSPVELTEAGVIAAEKRKAQQEKWAKFREEKEMVSETEEIDIDGGLSAVNEQEEITDEEELVAPEWPFPKVEKLPNYPAGDYTIRIWGRTREIGVMRSIGAVDREIMRTVIVEGLVIGGISWLLGALLSTPITYLLSYIISSAIFQSQIAVHFTYTGFLIWLLVVLVLALLAA